MTEGLAQTATADIHHLASTRLAALDQRYTANRRQLVDALLQSPGPVTIGWILAEQTSLAQSSAYRNLVVLEEAGIVQRIVTSDDHASFELTETMTGQHHHHLICSHCGLILDVTLPASVEHELDSALAAEASRMAFVGEHHRVDLVGICQTCQD